MFDEYIRRWRLVPDGEPIFTATSKLLPVRFSNRPAMLKITNLDEERRGGNLMRWWGGQGAAPVLAYTEDAILLERAQNQFLLADFPGYGRDDEASYIICATTAKLHLPQARPIPADLMPLDRWFEPLFAAGPVQGGLLAQAATTAAELLAVKQDLATLHGDIHHGNILDFDALGWLAIDPKGLFGERAFDYANIACNPNYQTAMRPGRLLRQVEVIAGAAHLDSRRLLAWIVAWSGLSALFLLEDGLPPAPALGVGMLAAAALGL